MLVSWTVWERVPVTEFGRDDWNTANKIVAGITELKNA